MTVEDIIKAGERMQLIIWRHMAMPIEDHDGADEDDDLVKERQFLRALRHPRASLAWSGDRIYVVRGSDPLAQLFTMEVTP